MLGSQQMVKRVVACLCLALSLAWSPPARADDVAAAEALFNAGRELRDAGNYAEACPKFEASYKLDKQLGTLINIADCYEKLGRWATAWARYDAALEWAQQTNDDRLDFIREGKERMTPKLPKLVIAVDNADTPLVVAQDGTEVLRPMYGVALPVDPGKVTVTVSRGDALLETFEVEAVEGKTETLRIDLAEIARRHPQPLPKPDEPVVVVEKEPYDPTLRNVGLIVGGVGAVAILVAGGLEIAALVKKGQADADDACVNKFCSQEGLDDAESAATFAEVGQWVGIGGLVTLAVGATIFLVAPSEPDDEDEVSWRVTPLIDPRGGGIGIEGRF